MSVGRVGRPIRGESFRSPQAEPTLRNHLPLLRPIS
ncbi:protein of unknown function [Streptomyces murinus]